MRAMAIIIGLLAGPSMLLILARARGGKPPVHRIWRWALRWIYGIFAVGFALLAVVGTIVAEGDDGPALAAVFGVAIIFGLSGMITWGVYKLLTREADT